MRQFGVFSPGLDMDLYRYFHPHHNPRLRSAPLRMQELSELQLAVVELRNAVRRAEVRTAAAAVGALTPERFAEVSRLLEAASGIFDRLISEHPDDDVDMLKTLIRERSNAPGWEGWTHLVAQRLEVLQEEEFAFRAQGQEPRRSGEDL